MARGINDPLDPYFHAGSHPDVVVRVWDRLGADLPPAWRTLRDGRPVLAQPNGGRVVAIAWGSAYAVLVPKAARQRAIELGLTSTQRWSNGTVTDLRQQLGEGWYFGKWRPEEKDWCEQSCRDVSAGDGRQGELGGE
jgi:hypothetical protein